MMNRVVVMGGSFNPPTRAHLYTMVAAIEAVDACQGIFVPQANEYVAKKMKRQKCPQDTLSESIRLAMLESFCENDSRISVSRLQMMKEERGYDYEMLASAVAQCLSGNGFDVRVYHSSSFYMSWKAGSPKRKNWPLQKMADDLCYGCQMYDGEDYVDEIWVRKYCEGHAK